MIAIGNDMLQVGDVARFTGGQRHLRVAWWKVVSIEAGVVNLVDRHGATARVRASRRYHEQHALKWTPGDPRNDGIED